MARHPALAALTAALALPLLAAPALADEVCVRIDEKNDTLSEIDRKGALAVARAAFQKAGEAVVDSPCDNQYIITNSRLGETIFANISGPKGQRDAKAARVDELGDLYQQMVTSLVTGETMGDSVTRHNVTSRQQNPKRVTADSVYWFGLGPAYILGVSPGDVPLHIGGGWRYELDQFGLEVVMGVTFASNSDDVDTEDDESETSINGSLGIAGYWYADEEASNTPYFGVGLGWGGTTLYNQDGNYDGSGLQGTLSGGYEFLRASTLRLFIQFDAILPMYDLDLDRSSFFASEPSPNAPESQYAPLFMIKFAVGWAPRGSMFRVF